MVGSKRSFTSGAEDLYHGGLAGPSMPFLMGHMVGGWLFGRFAQRVAKRELSHLEWGLLLFGTLLPDVDHLFDWLFQAQAHRLFTHSIVFLLVLFGGVYIVSNLFGFLNTSMDAKRNAIMVAAGAMTHMVLDMALGAPGTAFLWPHQVGLWLFGTGPLPDQAVFNIVTENPKLAFAGAIVDMCIGGAWIGYFFITKRIRF